ncbi:hypothetical protein C8R45DRAFT_1039428 [Mycena sanguinolenta]|nr:hypothetical protein C8R45DRAFT_1039428 [Mycena sanguinolenta]
MDTVGGVRVDDYPCDRRELPAYPAQSSSQTQAQRGTSPARSTRSVRPIREETHANAGAKVPPTEPPAYPMSAPPPHSHLRPGISLALPSSSARGRAGPGKRGDPRHTLVVYRVAEMSIKLALVQLRSVWIAFPSSPTSARRTSSQRHFQ